MIFGSVCSGIEAASVAWHPLGWKAAWYSEIEPFPCAVLKHHYPDVPNLGDMTKLHDSEVFNGSNLDVLVGGTPCQSFSIAGLRKGMDDPRGNLALVFLALLNRKRPRWVVWENVPGVLSSWSDEAGSFQDEGHVQERGWQSNDFDTFTSGLRELGYGIAWRVLDAQHFGVPQRRQRVFVVGHLGDWRPAAAVLFESHGLSGNPAPRRQAGKGTSRDVGRSLKASGGFKGAEDHETLIAHTLRGEGFDASEDGTGRGTPIVFGWQNSAAQGDSVSTEVSPSLDKSKTPAVFNIHGTPLVPHPHVDVMPTLRAGASNGGAGHGARSGDSKDEYIIPMVTDMRGNGDGENVPTLTGHHAGAVSDFSPMVFQPGNLVRGAGSSPSEEVAPTLKSDHGRGASDQDPHVMVPKAFMENQRGELRTSEVADAIKGQGGKPGQGYSAAMVGAAVRRLTPRECERLQGFPDDYTLIPYRGGVAADGPRYKACGNSMAVPVMRWIGERIQMVDDVLRGKK